MGLCREPIVDGSRYGGAAIPRWVVRAECIRYSDIMSVRKKNRFGNPFYALLVIVGVFFCVTACAYGVMTVRGLHANPSSSPAGDSLLRLMDRYGSQLLFGQIVVLSLFTFAAIGTDGYWERRGRKAKDEGQRMKDEKTDGDSVGA